MRSISGMARKRLAARVGLAGPLRFALMVVLTMNGGPPLVPPGAAFHYSDTGYILLGEVIESLTGQSMPRVLAERLAYRRLGIHHTWFETLEPVPTGAPDRT